MTRFPQLRESMFSGSIVALVTPFTDSGSVDIAAAERLVDFHLEQGSNGVVVAGTTGESATLAKPEFHELLSVVIRRIDGAVPVLAGTGSAATDIAVEQTRRAGQLGADAALVVTPYYNRPTQSGLQAHFRAIADDSEIPIVLYNVPSRTAVDMLPATVERLAAHPRIVAIKEAKRDLGRVEELVARCGPDFAVLSGDDPSCLAAMRRGARGVVSVAANVVPAIMQRLCASVRARNTALAQELDGRLQPLYEALALETNPIPVKWALFEMKLIGPQIRLPLTQLDDAHQEALRHCLASLGLLDD